MEKQIFQAQGENKKQPDHQIYMEQQVLRQKREEGETEISRLNQIILSNISYQQNRQNELQKEIDYARFLYDKAYRQKKAYVQYRDQINLLRERYQRNIDQFNQKQLNLQRKIKVQRQNMPSKYEIMLMTQQYQEVQDKKQQKTLRRQQNAKRMMDLYKQQQKTKRQARRQEENDKTRHYNRKDKQSTIDLPIKQYQKKKPTLVVRNQPVLSIQQPKQPKRRIVTQQVYYDKFRRFEQRRFHTNAADIKQLYESIVNESTYDKRKTQIVLKVRSADRQKEQFIQIQAVDDYEEFLYRFEQIMGSSEFGSGLSDMNVDQLDTTFFGFKQYNISVNGHTDQFEKQAMYEYIQVPEIYKDKCILNCLQYYGEDVKEYVKVYNSLKPLELIKKIVQDRPNLRICVSNNQFDKIQDYEGPNRQKKRIFRKDEKNGHLVQGKKEYDDFYPVIVSQTLNVFETENMLRKTQINILMDYKTKHAEVLKRVDDYQVRNCQDYYKSITGKILCQKGEKIKVDKTFTQASQAVQPYFEDKHQVCIFSFDFETVFDVKAKNMLKPYSCSYFYFLGGKYRAGCFYGFDCVAQLINVMKSIWENAIIVLLGFNNSKFDNFCLIDELTKQDLLSDIKFQGNQIVKLVINKRHYTYDLCKILVSSLKTCCQSFQIENAKREFDHNIVQGVFMQYGDLEQYFGEKSYVFQNTYEPDDKKKFTFKKCEEDVDSLMINSNLRQLIKYNILDCAALLELYHKVDSLFQQLKITTKDLYEYKTIASIPHRQFQEDKVFFKDGNELTRLMLNQNNQDKIPLQLPSLEQFKTMVNSTIAGRNQCFMHKQFIKGVQMVGKDACSLYPTQMLSEENDYGVGSFIKCSYEECKRNGLIGFYFVRFNQENLRITIIPQKKKDGRLDWFYKGEQVRELCTIDIMQLEKYNCQVEVLKNEDGEDIGFCREGTEKGSQMFKRMKDVAAIKTEQDRLKAIKSKDYNPSVRNLIKLIINSLSGKFGFKKFIEQTTYINNGEQGEERVLQKEKVDQLDLVHQINETKYIVKYEADLGQQLNKKSNNLCIDISVEIYCYARKYMYDQILCHFNKHLDLELYYTDTDSVTMPQKTWDFLRDKYGIKDFDYRAKQEKQAIKEFGEFESEFEPNEINIIAPKNYFNFQKKDGEIKLKGGFKGIKMQSDVYIPKSQLVDVLQMDQKQLFEYYTDKKNKLLSCEYDLEKKVITQEAYDRLHLFINGIRKGEPQFMLCSSLNKQIKDVKKCKLQGEKYEDETKKGLRLYQCFNIKEITAECQESDLVLKQTKRQIKQNKKIVQQYLRKQSGRKN